MSAPGASSRSAHHAPTSTVLSDVCVSCADPLPFSALPSRGPVHTLLPTPMPDNTVRLRRVDGIVYIIFIKLKNICRNVMQMCKKTNSSLCFETLQIRLCYQINRK